MSSTAESGALETRLWNEKEQTAFYDRFQPSAGPGKKYPGRPNDYLNHPESKVVSIFIKTFMILCNIVTNKVVNSISKVCQPAEKNIITLFAQFAY